MTDNEEMEVARMEKRGGVDKIKDRKRKGDWRLERIAGTVEKRTGSKR